MSSTQPVSASGTDFHGGGEYAKTVFYRLCELLPAEIFLDVFYDPQRNIDKWILEICKTRQFTVHYCKNNAELSKLLNSKNYDVFYSALPYSYTDLAIPLKTKFVYTVHGLRGLEYPADKYELKYKKNGIKALIKHFLFLFFSFWWKPNRIKKRKNNYNKLFSLTSNQAVITISNHTKYSIAYFFPKINISTINVLYPPLKKYNFSNNINTEIITSFSLESGKYILLACGNRSEKGAYRACRVLYNLMKNQGGIPESMKFVILGISYCKPYRKLVKNNPRFLFNDYVSTETLEALYKNAHLFIFPTLNEGFGITPLEAMKYGTLCACSANSSITEVYGDSVLYFNPHDETEMCIRILQSFDENIRCEKANKMLERCKLIRKKQDQDLDLLIQNIIS